jgi:hypothetical protein
LGFIRGIEATGAVGSVVQSHSIALIGVSADTAVATVVHSRSIALTGVQAAGAVGMETTAETITIALTGVQSAAAINTLQEVQRTNAIIGRIVAGAVGSFGVDNWILIDTTIT